MSENLLVDVVSTNVIDFTENENFLFIATTCKHWRRSWGKRPPTTNPITTSTSASQLAEAIESGVSLYHLCSHAVALGRRDLVHHSRELGAPWATAMAQAAKLNDFCLVKFLQQLGCPMSANVFEVFSYRGNLEALAYLMQSGCPSGRCMEYAATSKNTTTLRWLRDNGGRLDATSFAAACLTGDVEVIAWFERNECAWDERVLPFAARSGNLEAVKLLVSMGFEMTMEATKAAAGLKSIDTLTWLVAHGCPLGKSACAQASKDGRLENLKWVRERGAEWGPQVCAVAAKFGHHEILTWARKEGCEWDSTTLRGAAAGGQFNILRWAVENDCPMTDPLVCASAANGGHTEILRWLREEKNFGWDARTMMYAAEAGHYDIIEYCLAKACPVDSSVVHAAASANRLQIMRSLVGKGCPTDEDACVAAAASGDIQMLEYFRGLGYVLSIRCIWAARKNYRWEMITWLEEQM